MFQKQLLIWYQTHKRPLSFRQDRDAYKIWISEIMAQQTRIEAMLPYFDRFMKEVPDMRSLVTISDERLNKLWQGLGYYSRARNLKKCAQECMVSYRGKLPQTKAELCRLPGIGPYTAGAIASIAFHENVSAVDGNVYRVFSRLYDIHEDMRKSKGKKIVEEKVDNSLPGSDSISDYNQALMELGALVCIPKHPRCEQCPISMSCQSRLHGDPGALPILSKPKPRKVEKKHIYIWVYKDRIHIRKRIKKGLLAGLYEFDETLPDQYLAIEDIDSYTHIFSHVEWQMDASIVYMDEGDADFHPISTIKQTYALPGAFLPFFEQAVKKIDK